MILKLLEKVCHKLEEIHTPYILSGSLAMNVYAVPRMTWDIDIVIHLRLRDVASFSDLFREGFYLHVEGIKQEIRRQGLMSGLFRSKI